MTSIYLTRPLRSLEEVKAERAARERRDPMLPFAQARAESAEIARSKLRMARADHRPRNGKSEWVIDTLSHWVAGFAS